MRIIYFETDKFFETGHYWKRPSDGKLLKIYQGVLSMGVIVGSGAGSRTKVFDVSRLKVDGTYLNLISVYGVNPAANVTRNYTRETGIGAEYQQNTSTLDIRYPANQAGFHVWAIIELAFEEIPHNLPVQTEDPADNVTFSNISFRTIRADITGELRHIVTNFMGEDAVRSNFFIISNADYDTDTPNFVDLDGFGGTLMIGEFSPTTVIDTNATVSAPITIANYPGFPAFEDWENYTFVATIRNNVIDMINVKFAVGPLKDFNSSLNMLEVDLQVTKPALYAALIGM